MTDPETSITVVVVDDHHVVRSGIIGWIESEPDMTVVGSGSTADEAVDLVSRHTPSVLLIDLHLRGRKATDVAHTLRDQGSTTCIIVMTGYEKNRVRQVLASGANGYLSKEDKREVMIDAIRWGASGTSGIWVSPSSLQFMLEIERELRDAELTKMEMQILAMIDMSNTEICTDLGISDGTLRNHLSNIYFKLRVQNRSEAAAKARHLGLTQS